MQARRSIGSLSLVLLAGPAFAQQTEVVFLEDFESGYASWTMTGQWNEESETDQCGSLIAPFPSSSHAAWYGTTPQCAFYSGAFLGDLTLVNPIALPEHALSARLRFSTYEDTECDSCKWDWRFVYVSTDAGQTWEFIGEGNQLHAWYERELDLTPYLGADILLRFEFDAVDSFGNDGLGWMVDDILVEVEVCPEPTNVCVTSPNSVGSGAIMAGRGSTSIAANYFKATAEHAPPGQFGIFYYGPELVQIPFGDGWRCIGTGGIGTFRLNPPVLIDNTGFAFKLVDFTVPPAGSGPGKIEPASTWYFQFWYRDPAFGGTGFNLSDALSVLFCP